MTQNKAFKTFLDQHGGNYPYCDVRQTRTAFHTEWLLLTDSSLGSTVEGYNPDCDLPEHYVLRTSTLPQETVQEIIIRRNGLPLPPDLCEVICFMMSFWGQCQPVRWKERILSMFHQLLGPQHGGFDGPPTRQEVFYKAVCELVFYKYYGLRHYEQVRGEFEDEVLKLYHSHSTFSSLAIQSTNFFRRRLDYLSGYNDSD